MLIRNAKLNGCAGLTDLRLMHGTVQEIGTNLVKGLYEAELDLQGDALRPWQGEPLPRSLRRHVPASPSAYIVPGTPEPLMRYAQGRCIGPIHQHSAD